MVIELHQALVPVNSLQRGDHLTPREIVAELDKYIIGQDDAKRSVAIALRNRWRRQQVPEDLRDEIAPKNIIMIGPTGVGKTEIARRLAKLTASPFLKIEATKFTEVGYVGRDVESMVRDLMELAVTQVKAEERDKVQAKAEAAVEERLLDLLLPGSTPETASSAKAMTEADLKKTPQKGDGGNTREKLRTMLRAGRLDDRLVELEVSQRTTPVVEIFSAAGMEEMDFNFKDMLGNLFPGKTKQRKVKVAEAREYLLQEEAGRLIDMDRVVEEARRKVEQNGIIFLDEIDKIVGRDGTRGPDVSREGVQRDLLPIVEGTTVNSKYGMLRTDHILFIASGAFHLSKPSDLIPEMQGRFPIRVELHSLGAGGVRTHPDGAGKRPDQAVPGPVGHRRHPAHLHPGGGQRDRRPGHEGERTHRKHRRPAAAHGHGKAAGGDFLYGPGPHGPGDHHHRRLRPGTPGRAHRGRGFEPVYFVSREG